MQSSTIIVLACVLAVVAANSLYEKSPAVDAVYLPDDAAVHESIYDTPAHDRSARTKRGLLLLKKKLLLGALGLKAAKVGAVGVAGALALKKAKSSGSSHSYYGNPPTWNVEVHSWSG